MQRHSLKTKKSYLILFLILALGIMAVLVLVFFDAEYIPPDYQLKAPKQDIINYQTKEDIVVYTYKGDPIEPEENEIIEKRTNNARYFKTDEPNKVSVTYSIGNPYYQEDNEWRYVKTATLPLAYFKEQTKLAWWEKLWGREALADTIDAQVGVGANDGTRWAATNFSATLNRAIAGQPTEEYGSFFRFTGITLEGTIDVSYFECYGYGNNVGSVELKVRAVDEDNPDAPISYGQYDADPLTTAGVDWDGGWTNNIWNQSPSLNSVIQELVDSYTISNDALMIRIDDDQGVDGNWTNCDSVESASANPVKLHIEYTTAGEDTVSPVRSNGSPSGTLTSGTTQTNISLNTNESATCKYGTVAGTIYTSLPNTFSTTGNISHSSTITGLTNGQSYTYYVRCQDTASNQNTNDFAISFSVASPAQPGWPGWSNLTTIYYDPSQEDGVNTFLQQAAQELRNHLQKAGKTLTINTTSKPSSGAIYLEVNTSHPNLIGRGEEAFSLYATTNGVYITGKTAMAVRHGAFAFLDKLGFRWYFKSPIWEVIPNSLIDLGALSEVQEPSYFFRNIVPARDNDRDMTRDWNMRNLGIGSTWCSAIHSYRSIINRLAPDGVSPSQELIDHPEWFTGAPGTGGWQIDPLNSEVQARAIEYVSAKFDQGMIATLYTHEDLPMGCVPVSPNDGGGFNPPYDESDTQNITDIVFTMANEVAKVVAVKYPGKGISLLSYHIYAEVPTIELEPNVIPFVTSGMAQSGLSLGERIDGIVAKGVEVGVYQYLDMWAYGHDSPGISFDAINQVAWFNSRGVRAYNAESSDGWGGRDGLQHYLVRKLLWNSTADVNTLLADFYTKSFGPAASAMQNYYEVRNVDDAAIGASFRALDEAESLAAAYPDILERIRFLEYYNRYMWLWHNKGIINLTLNELKDFYTFIYRTRTMAIVTSRSTLDALNTELLSRGQTQTEINALQNTNLPTAAEARAWLDEALLAFSEYAVPFINPLQINLASLNNTILPRLDAMHSGAESILVPAIAGETVKVLVKGPVGRIEWFDPAKLQIDYREFLTEVIDWTPVFFAAPVAGTYILHLTQNRPMASNFYVDVPDRPAAIIADSGLSGLYFSPEPMARNAPEYYGGVDGWAHEYFYVPAGTPSFLFGANIVFARYSVSGQLTDPDGVVYPFLYDETNSTDSSIQEIQFDSPTPGVWQIDIRMVSRQGQFWVTGIPPLVWHDPQYLLIEAGGSPPPPSGFTLSATDRLHLFRDKTNTFQITGSSFDSTVDFRMDFYQGASLISTFTKRPTDSTRIDFTFTSTQTNTLPIGFYDLKVTKTTDSTAKTYSKQIVVTTLGDIWSSSATESTEQKRDGKVNIYDVSRMLSKWGSTNATDLALADINPGPSNISLNKIDLFDANLMMKNWRP